MDEHKHLKLRRGFGALSAERRREITTQGGRAAQALGVGHCWNFAEAQAAGRKGGESSGIRRLFLKHFQKECTATVTAFFMPLLIAPDRTSQFLADTSVVRKGKQTTRLDVVKESLAEFVARYEMEYGEIELKVNLT